MSYPPSRVDTIRAPQYSRANSPSFRVTRGRKVKVKLDRKVLYELDGGARTKAKRYRLAVEPGAITVCVPAASRNGDGTA